MANKQPFNELSKKEQLAIRKRLYNKWKENPTDNIQALKVLGANEGLPKGMIADLMEKDKWWDRLEKENKELKPTNKKEARKLAKEREMRLKKSTDEIDNILEECDVPERWKLFILHYLRDFNVKHAAISSGLSPTSTINWILNDDRVQLAISKIKKVMQHDIYISTHDILNEYVKIAFADMTQFVEFNGHTVKLKNSENIDGRMIQEVKRGKDGITIKLHDKMKALDKLDKIFELVPDRKLELERERFEFAIKQANKAEGENKNVTILFDI